jgi:hypothetical protein
MVCHIRRKRHRSARALGVCLGAVLFPSAALIQRFRLLSIAYFLVHLNAQHATGGLDSFLTTVRCMGHVTYISLRIFFVSSSRMFHFLFLCYFIFVFYFSYFVSYGSILSPAPIFHFMYSIF